MLWRRPNTDFRVSGVSVLVLAGGVGSRLRRVSSPLFPKQFIRLSGGLSSFQGTVNIAMSFVDDIRGIYIVTTVALARLACSQLREIGAGGANVLIEPRKRNTCGAVMFGLSRLPDISTTVVVMPSDCVMVGIVPYINVAADIVNKYKNIVLLGIPPSEINCNFGHIIPGRRQYYNTDARHILRFTEKPDETSAKILMTNCHCLWNSGIIICNGMTMLDEIKRKINDGTDISGYSIDSAILNYADNLSVLEAGNLFWSDIGSERNFLRIMNSPCIYGG